MELTGNPFVDVGFSVAAGRMGRSSVESLSRDDLRQVVGELHRDIPKLKDFKILRHFWNNNPFMGINAKQEPKFASFLNNLELGLLPTSTVHCQICGRSPVLREAVDRCWFPLAAGPASDPCTLPGLGGKRLCEDCLSAVVVLPLGCRYCPDGPYFVHMTESNLQVPAVSEGLAAVDAALAANTGDGINHGTVLHGRPALLDIASRSILWDHSQPGHLEHTPKFGATMISFSNGGNRTCFNQLHLPAQALEFFGAIAEAGVRPVFLGWAQEIQKRKLRPLPDELCDDVEERRSLGNLLFSLVRRREVGRLRKEECKVLEIYEDVALRKKERFDALQRIAKKVRDMPGRYRDSFIKQLGNSGSRDRLLDLLTDFCKRESTGLKITVSELRAMIDGPPRETASLLYLLCVADNEGKDE